MIKWHYLFIELKKKLGVPPIWNCIPTEIKVVR